MAVSIFKGRSVLLCGRPGAVNDVLCRTFKRAGLELLGEVATPEDAYHTVLHRMPAIIVYDLQASCERGLAVARTIAAGARIYQVLLTGYDPDKFVEQEEQILDATFVRKPTTSGELIAMMAEGYARFQGSPYCASTYALSSLIEAAKAWQRPTGQTATLR